MSVVLPLEYERMDHKFRDLGLQKLAPPADVYKLCWRHDQLFQQVEGKRIRRIFFNVQFQPEELYHIAEIRKLLIKENLNDTFTDAMIFKNFIAGKENYKKCVERLKQIQHFHTDEQLTKYDNSTKQALQRGYVYTYGYDKEYCPIVYTRPDLMNFNDQQFLNPLYCLMYVVQRYRMVPYHAQKYVLVIDLNHMKVSDIPYMKLYKIMHNVSCLYTGFVKKVVVLNSSGLGSIWKYLKMLIPQRAKKNIIFAKDYGEIDELISRSQRENKYLGELPDLTSFWPPTSTTPELTPRMDIQKVSNQSVLYQSLNSSFSEYYSIQNNEENFYNLNMRIPASENQKRCNCKCLLI